MTYNIIKDESDIKRLMEVYGYFHDSCIKEIKYMSGAYVSEELAMNPFNDQRRLSIIFQRQDVPNSVLELVFLGVNKLNLEPKDTSYDCIIYGAMLKKIDDLFYWNESDCLEDELPEEMLKDDRTWVLAEQVMWRVLPDALGDEPLYKMLK